MTRSPNGPVVNADYGESPLGWLSKVKVPHAALLFIMCMVTTWAISAWFSQNTYTQIDPTTINKVFSIDGGAVESGIDGEVTLVHRRGVWISLASAAVLALIIALWAIPADSALRGPGGSLTHPAAPLMAGIVPIIFLLFLALGLGFGFSTGKFKGSADVFKGMEVAISKEMAGYIVLAFFASLFIDSFNRSNLGKLVAFEGAEFLSSLAAPKMVTLIGIILLTTFVNLFIGSASAKWTILAAIFVPMLMKLGISPELTQAAYRVGDSSTNIITPLNPYFIVILGFASQYSKAANVGTLIRAMLPYSVCFLLCWTLLLLAFWGLDIPLGVGASYEYPAPK